MDLFNYKNQNIKNHFQRSTRIDNDLTKDFLDHFIFHSTGKKVLNQIPRLRKVFNKSIEFHRIQLIIGSKA